MTDDPITAGRLMLAARPFSPDEFDDACDDEVGRRALTAILGDEPALGPAAVPVRSAQPPHGPVHRPLRWTYPASLGAVAAAIAVIIAVVLSGQHGQGRSSSTAPAVGRPDPVASGSARASAEAARRAAAEAEAQRAAERAEAAEAARVCASDVRAVLGRMIAGYRRPGGGKAQALARLRSAHAPSSLEYRRDAAAFDDWIARGGPAGQVTIAAVVGHACVQ